MLTEGLGAEVGQPGLQGEVQMSSMPLDEPRVSAFAGRLLLFFASLHVRLAQRPSSLLYAMGGASRVMHEQGTQAAMAARECEHVCQAAG